MTDKFRKVGSLNVYGRKRGMHVLFDAHISDRKHLSSQLFEICLSPDDSSWTKQTVVAITF